MDKDLRNAHFSSPLPNAMHSFFCAYAGDFFGKMEITFFVKFGVFQPSYWLFYQLQSYILIEIISSVFKSLSTVIFLHLFLICGIRRRKCTRNIDRAEYGKDGLRVNAIAPGPTETPMVKAFYEANPAMKENATKGIPQKRLGTPEEVAELVTFLIPSKAEYINGELIRIDGGFTNTK